jgi:hypothetical protein
VCFTEAVRCYPTDLLHSDLQTWHTEAAQGHRGRGLVTRALAAARAVAGDWAEDDREQLAALEAAVK